MIAPPKAKTPWPEANTSARSSKSIHIEVGSSEQFEKWVLTELFGYGDIVTGRKSHCGESCGFDYALVVNRGGYERSDVLEIIRDKILEFEQENHNE